MSKAPHLIDRLWSDGMLSLHAALARKDRSSACCYVAYLRQHLRYYLSLRPDDPVVRLCLQALADERAP